MVKTKNWLWEIGMENLRIILRAECQSSFRLDIVLKYQDFRVFHSVIFYKSSNNIRTMCSVFKKKFLLSCIRRFRLIHGRLRFLADRTVCCTVWHSIAIGIILSSSSVRLSVCLVSIRLSAKLCIVAHGVGVLMYRGLKILHRESKKGDTIPLSISLLNIDRFS